VGAKDEAARGVGEAGGEAALADGKRVGAGEAQDAKPAARGGGDGGDGVAGELVHIGEDGPGSAGWQGGKVAGREERLMMPRLGEVPGGGTR